MTGTGRPIRTDQMPIAHARPTAREPISKERVRDLIAAVNPESVERWLVPADLDADGTACVVMFAPSPKIPREIRRTGSTALMSWRWNVTPSNHFSLTVMGPKAQPFARWMSTSDSPAVRAIHAQARFFLLVVARDGTSSGWMEAVYHDSVDPQSPTSRSQLDKLWTFPAAGIPFSALGERFIPMKREEYSEVQQIPLWADPIADFWTLVRMPKATWSAELSQRDHAVGAWGRHALKARADAAGFVEALKQAQALDGRRPMFDADGQLQRPGGQDVFTAALKGHPDLGIWLAALGGPGPDALTAHQALKRILASPKAVSTLIGLLFKAMPDAVVDEEDDLFACAVSESLRALFLDPEVTGCGTLRPWLASVEEGFELRKIPVDLTAPVEDLESLWWTGLEVIDLLEIGNRVDGSEFPVRLADINEAMLNVAIDGTYEECEQKIDVLLQEAKVARQWSIPWGARVELNFGPFVAVKIFEQEGEFSCHFVDERDRYFHVAVGLRGQPTIASRMFVRTRSDDNSQVWNRDAELSLKLIAASIVRDFVVVEDRTSVFMSRPFRRRFGNRNVRSVIYLPRVRYSRGQVSRLHLEEGAVARARHSVSPHLRRSNKVSAAQRFLAQRYGFPLPTGFTFVRPHERGTAAEEARVRVYRSRSASLSIYEGVDVAPGGSRPQWFDFEKDCARLLRTRGMSVIHQAAQRDGDGGVDLFAIDKDGEPWVIQCKCWASQRPVGPEVVRELQGAMLLADRGGKTPSRGMVLTTSVFTTGAIEAAQRLGIILLPGHELAAELRSRTQ